MKISQSVPSGITANIKLRRNIDLGPRDCRDEHRRIDGDGATSGQLGRGQRRHRSDPAAGPAKAKASTLLTISTNASSAPPIRARRSASMSLLPVSSVSPYRSPAGRDADGGWSSTSVRSSRPPRCDTAFV